MEELEWERLKAYSKILRSRWHGRVPLGEDPPLPTPTRKTSAEQLESAHLEFSIRNFAEAIALARDVEKDAYRTAQKADAARLRALAHAALGEWIDAIVAAQKAVELEPDGDSVEVKSAELPSMIVHWRSILLANRRSRGALRWAE